jgi:hypothetical protein
VLEKKSRLKKVVQLMPPLNILPRNSGEQIPRRLKPVRDDKKNEGTTLSSLPRDSKRQIPHRLKSVRDDKYKDLAAAHPFGKLRAWLKLCPFEIAICRIATCRVFQQSARPALGFRIGDFDADLKVRSILISRGRRSSATYLFSNSLRVSSFYAILCGKLCKIFKTKHFCCVVSCFSSILCSQSIQTKHFIFGGGGTPL